MKIRYSDRVVLAKAMGSHTLRVVRNLPFEHPEYQLQLVKGHETWQFPTSGKLNRKALDNFTAASSVRTTSSDL